MDFGFDAGIFVVGAPEVSDGGFFKVPHLAEFAVEESFSLLLVEGVSFGAGEAVDLGEVVGQFSVGESCAVLYGAGDVGVVLFLGAHGRHRRPRSHVQ